MEPQFQSELTLWLSDKFHIYSSQDRHKRFDKQSKINRTTPQDDRQVSQLIIKSDRPRVILTKSLICPE